MLHSSAFSTNRPSPLRKNADQHNFDEQPPWQKPLHHQHGKATKTTRKARQRVNGGSRNLIRGASHRSSSSHDQPNLQPGVIYVDPDDSHRQCITSAPNNDFPWEELASLLPTGLPMTSNVLGKICKLVREYCVWRASHTYRAQPRYDLATSHRQTSCSSSMLTLRGVHQGCAVLRKTSVERISAARSRIQVRSSAPTQSGPDSLQNRRPTTSWD